MNIGTFEIVMAVVLALIMMNAAVWMIVTARRHDGEQRHRAANWSRAYFRQGGQLCSLIARWSPQRRLADQSKDPID